MNELATLKEANKNLRVDNASLRAKVVLCEIYQEERDKAVKEAVRHKTESAKLHKKVAALTLELKNEKEKHKKKPDKGDPESTTVPTTDQKEPEGTPK